MPREIHVDLSGRDTGDGAADSPIATISRAAAIAEPGDTVIVHEGMYREWVRPRHGGLSDAERITFTAAPGERAVISGSERVTGWERVSETVWSVRVPDSFFGEWNPFREVLSGDWFHDNGRDHLVGELFAEGRSLFEVPSRDRVLDPVPWDRALDPEASMRTWCCEPGANSVTLIANFQGLDPNKEAVEVSVRPACFYPDRTGVDYITVRGFEMCNAATRWAPPTAEQWGIVGPHWAKGWVIEENVIHDGKCSGISLGVDGATADNLWSRIKRKHGFQREHEVIMRALAAGWSRDSVGSHVVRNNTIYSCGQTGICGHLGAVFSEIYGNHIHHIHEKDLFTGHEMGGIKLHAAIDVQIRANRIHHCTQGIWLDWQAQGTRVSANLLYENRWNDLFVEVSHGPYVVDNNIMLSPLSIRECAQGGCYAHNLVGGWVSLRNVPNRFTPYHFPHSTTMLGNSAIRGGDDRYLNNLFVPLRPEEEGGPPRLTAPDENREHAARAPSVPAWHAKSVGLSAFDTFPTEISWESLGRSVDEYAAVRHAVSVASNAYASPAEPCVHETGAVTSAERVGSYSLNETDTEVRLTLEIGRNLADARGALVTSERLGHAFESEAPFDNPDGTRLALDRDYFGLPRRDAPRCGPFESSEGDCISFVVWPPQEKEQS